MTQTLSLFSSLIILTFLSTTHLNAAVEEIEGGSDFTNVGRVAGSTLIGFEIQEYGESLFIEDDNGERKNNYTKRYDEGSISRYMYVLKPGQSPLLAIKNFQDGFAELGQVTDIYSCRASDCNKDLGQNIAWHKNRRFNTNSGSDLNLILGNSGIYAYDQRYWFASVTSEDANYSVSVYAAKANSRRKSSLKNIEADDTMVRVDIVTTNKIFEKNLEIVDASAIETKISQTGFIDLYGLYFDTGSHTLKDSSEPTMSEISKFLQANPEIKIFVVGHTDSDGSVDLNQTLSKRRAEEVVNRLVRDNGIESARLIGVGAGLISPVASNDTEEGKALNRRVVLVKNSQ